MNELELLINHVRKTNPTITKEQLLEKLKFSEKYEVSALFLGIFQTFVK